MWLNADGFVATTCFLLEIPEYIHTIIRAIEKEK